MTREELLEALKSLRERLPYHDTASRLVIGEAIAALLARVSCTFCFAEDKSLMTCCKDCFKKLGRQAPCACGELLDALIWCSGSQDFGPGGVARKGWLKKCKPLLDRLLPAEEVT